MENICENHNQTQSVRMKTTHLDFVVVTGQEGASEENRRYWKSTPSGTIHLGTVNQAAIDELVDGIGCAFYVTFERAPENDTRTKVRRVVV